MIVSEGKATATEIEQNWTYSDLLKCILYSDIEAIRAWKVQPRSQNSQDEIFFNPS